MITHGRLLELLLYDPETGEFHRKNTSKIAGCVKTTRGYTRLIISLDNKQYKAHRLAWFYMTGEWPTNIDHVDMDTLNNQWSNLREANKSQNGHNRGPQANNTSGYKNITFHKPTQKWQVKFQVDGHNKSFGLYENIELANLVACEVRDSIHKEFARHA